MMDAPWRVRAASAHGSPPPPRNTSGCRGSHHSLTSGGAARLLPGEPAPAIQPSRQPGANGRDAGSTSHLEGHLRGQPIRVCRSALAALVLALAALGAAPATAQTLSISATANCGGTPANCGTSDNRNGDKLPKMLTPAISLAPRGGPLHFHAALVG